MSEEDNTKLSLDSLDAWYSGAAGTTIMSLVAAELTRKLDELTVQDVLYLGVAGYERLLTEAKAKPSMFFTDMACEHLLANEDTYLPIKSESQECVVLLHGLDIAVNPHAVLRELSRIITKDGYLIIIGFNQVSFFGLYKPIAKLLNWRNPGMPWKLKFHGLRRLRDWLELLGFEVGRNHTLGFRPLLKQQKFLRVCGFLDTVGRLILPPFGNIYICLARKRTVPLTPEPLVNKIRAALIKAGLPKTRAEGV